MSRTPDRTRDASLAGTTGGPNPSDPPIFADGATIGTRYRLSRFIARGGMGEVYAARDLELGTEIAIKTIRAERIGDPAAIARLKQEILAARKVTHPNVVRLFDVGFHVIDDQREIAFFTMELVAGETLDARIRTAGRLAPEAALGLATQMAGALDALHAAGIVHRDFKSPNVLVVEDRAIVTDFGLARDRDDNAAKTTLFEMVGTPGYMAPEQVTRDREIGPAADIYAFGVVLYEMVTGELPFRRDTALATAAARLERDPPPPRSLVPALPAAWDAAILRCLRRDPAQRFARASEVVAALTRRAPMPWKPIAAGAGLAIAAIGTYALWPRDQGGAVGACTAPTGPDLYVDATAPLGGTGAAGCPFRTISNALAVQAERRIVHVAPGFYDRALGERFPLVLRGEVSLVGAGQDLTTISGVGTYDAQPAAGTLGPGTWQASIVVGDAARPIEIAELALAPALSSVQRGSVGIACTRGVRDGAANTRVRAVAIGGYGYGIIAGTETAPVETGCNLDVSASRLHDGMGGIWVVGCGNGAGLVDVDVQVRDTRFESFRTPDPMLPGRGIAVWDCTRKLVVEHSVFVDSDAGLDIIRHAGEGASPVMQVRDNEFNGLSRAGIMTTLSVLADIRSNRFSRVTGIGEFLGRAAAIKVYVDGEQGPSLQVRDNRFVENDIALEVWGIAPLPASVVLDFGRDGDPGGNTFFCNAAPAVSTVPGGDIAIRLPAAPGTRLDLQGNKWDHAMPTRSTTPVNGLDILDIKASPLAVNTAGATFHGSEYCMQRRR